MATDKRFVVKNGLQTENINFVFNDAVVGSSNITATMLSSNVLSFSGTSGQLFSIADTMTGVIFAVNDISGVPSIEVYDDGRIRMAESFGNVIIGNSTVNTSRTSTSTSTGILQVAGGAGIVGNINVGGTKNLFTGNVGIGTSAVTGANSNVLTIYGTASYFGNITLSNLAAGGSGIYFPDGTFQTTAATAGQTSSGIAGTVQFSGGSGTFAGDAANFFWDDTNNRLGIGSSAPSNTLTVWGATPAWFNTTNGSNIFEVLVGNATTTAATLGYASTPTSPYSYIKNAGGTVGLVVLNSGSVGVRGITNPLNALDVGGAVAVGGGYAGVRTAPTNGLIVQTSVGIGTFTVASTLDVWGTGSFTAALSAGGQASVASLVSNANIFGATLSTSGQATVASLVVNANITTATLNSTGAAQVSSLTSNGAVTATTIMGTAGTFTSLQNSGTTTTNALVSNVYGRFSQNVTVNSTNVSTSTTTGALILAGGAGIGGNVNAGGAVHSFQGSVGIGTLSPVSQLHVTTDGSATNRGLTIDQHNTGAQAALGNFRKSRGTLVSPTTVANGDYTGAFTFQNYDGSAYRTNAGFGARINGTVASNSVPTDLYFWAGSSDDSDPYTNNTVKMLISSGGRVGIGTISPGSPLDVNGNSSFRSAVSVAGTAIVSALISNNNIFGSTLNTSGAAQLASLNVNAGTYTNTLNVNTTANVNALTSNTGITVSAGGLIVTGLSTFTGNVGITGNLTVTGTINTQNANVLVVNDPIIYLGEGNTSNLWDLGIIANYNDGVYEHTGLVRNRNDGIWTLFDNMTSEPNVSTGNINWNDSTLTFAPMKLGNLTVAGNTRSTSSTSGAIVLGGLGGIGVGGNIYVGGQQNGITGNLWIAGSNASTTSATGALVVSNGVGIGGALNVGGQIYTAGVINAGGTAIVNALTSNGAVSGTTGTFTGALYGASFNTAGTATVNALVSNGAVSGTAATFTSLQNSGTITTNALVSNVYGLFGQNVTVNSANASTTTGTGALVVAGGAGIGGRVNVGGAAWFASTLNAGGALIAQSINSNTNVVGVNLQSTGQASVASLVSNGAITGTTITGTNYLVTTASSTAASGAAIQRVFSKTVAATELYKLAEYSQSEGIVAIEIQVASQTSANSGTTTYRFQGGYSSLAGSYYRLMPFNDGRGHGEGPDTGFSTLAWEVYIYGTTVSGQPTIYGVAVSVPTGAVTKTLFTTITELRRGMTFTDRSADAVVTSFTNSGIIYSHRNLLVESEIGIGTSNPLSALDVRGGIGITGTANFGGAVSVASLVSNGAVSGTAGTFTGALYGASFNTAGTATVNALVSNGAITATTITGTAGTFTSIQNSGNLRSANIVSNTWIHATQNLTVASSNTSTSTATGALVVSGGIGAAGNLYASGNVVAASFQPTSASVPNNGMYLPTTNTLAFSTAGAEEMRLTANGNLLLGTSTLPAGSTATMVLLGTGTNGSGIEFSNVNVGGANIGTGFSNSLVFSTYVGAIGSETYTERMRINTGNVNLSTNLTVNTGTTSLFGGNVGIGTVSSLGATGNVFSIYGSENLYGNLVIRSSAAGGAGVYFPDGTFQTTAATGGGGGGATVYTFSYTGNGTTTAYGTSPYTGSVSTTDVFVNGVYQRKSTYTWVGTTLTFSSAPPNFSTIEINILASAGNVSTLASQVRQTFTAGSGQTAFTVTGGYASGQIDIYQNGSKLNVGSDVIAVDGSSFTLTNPARVGDTIEIVALYGVLASFPNAYPITGGVLSGNMTVGGGAVSTSSTTGAIVIGSSGGIGVGGNVNVGGNINVSGTRSTFTGFVGVGAASVPGYALDVTGEVAIRGGEGVDDARLYFQASDNSNRFTIETDLDGTTSNDLLGFRATSADNILVLKGNGTVGLGTTAPGSTLDVNGVASFRSTISSAGQASVASLVSNANIFGATLNTSGAAQFASLVSNASATATTFIPSGSTAPTNGMYLPTTNTVGFSTNSVERMRITATGNVIMGTSASTTTQASLMVSGNTNNGAVALAALDAATISIKNDSVGGLGLTSKLNFNVAAIGASVVAGYYAAFNASNDIGTGLQFGTQTNAAGGTVERMRIDQFGNVSIGTSSAFYQSGGRTVLSVNGSSAAMVAIGTGGTQKGYVHFDGTNLNVQSDSGALGLATSTANPVVIYTNGIERMRIDSSGNVGIGTSTITTGYRLQVQGGFAATTKSFVIKHPTKPGMLLRHGSLEGPENGVYVRGRSTETVIRLPDYWEGLVDMDTVTVNITPIGSSQSIYVRDIRDNLVYLGSADGHRMEYFYTVFAERKDVPQLLVEE